MEMTRKVKVRINLFRLFVHGNKDGCYPFDQKLVADTINKKLSSLTNGEYEVHPENNGWTASRGCECYPVARCGDVRMVKQCLPEELTKALERIDDEELNLD